MEKEANSLHSNTEEAREYIIKLITPFWREMNGDIQSILKEVEAGFSGEVSDALIDRFEGNAQQLTTLLDPHKRAHALMIVRQLINKDSADAAFTTESLKILVECLFFFLQLEDPDDVRHFFKRFQQQVGIDLEKEEEIHLDQVMLAHLSEMLIILATSDGLVQAEKEFIFSLITKEWEGNPNEVAPFLNDIFQAVEIRESQKHDLVERFREVTETLSKMGNDSQKKKISEIIEGLIDADSKVSVQEKMLYKIVKIHMGE